MCLAFIKAHSSDCLIVWNFKVSVIVGAHHTRQHSASDPSGVGQLPSLENSRQTSMLLKFLFLNKALGNEEDSICAFKNLN